VVVCRALSSVEEELTCCLSLADILLLLPCQMVPALACMSWYADLPVAEISTGAPVFPADGRYHSSRDSPAFLGSLTWAAAPMRIA
jgi:hypothetical protein